MPTPTFNLRMLLENVLPVNTNLSASLPQPQALNNIFAPLEGMTHSPTSMTSSIEKERTGAARDKVAGHPATTLIGAMA